GKKKAAEFGDEFLQVIRNYCSEHNIEPDSEILKPLKSKKKTNTKAKTTSPVADTKKETFALFKQGLSLEQIATQRQLTQGTIAGHLRHFVKSGEIKATELMSGEKLQTILLQIGETDDVHSLSAIKARLPEEFTYHEIGWAL